jgi:hypothetical protein
MAMSAKVEATGEAGESRSNMVEAATVKKHPPPESAESILSRRFILLSFWAVAILFGLPIWWQTTTVYRAPLPLQPMLDWADGKVSVMELIRLFKVLTLRLGVPPDLPAPTCS